MRQPTLLRQLLSMWLVASLQRLCAAKQLLLQLFGRLLLLLQWLEMVVALVLQGRLFQLFLQLRLLFA
jgi:hypothetical protein